MKTVLAIMWVVLLLWFLQKYQTALRDAIIKLNINSPASIASKVDSVAASIGSFFNVKGSVPVG